jgi:hypothetical protein
MLFFRFVIPNQTWFACLGHHTKNEFCASHWISFAINNVKRVFLKIPIGHTMHMVGDGPTTPFYANYLVHNNKLLEHKIIILSTTNPMKQQKN